MAPHGLKAPFFDDVQGRMPGGGMIFQKRIAGFDRPPVYIDGQRSFWNLDKAMENQTQMPLYLIYRL